MDGVYELKIIYKKDNLRYFRQKWQEYIRNNIASFRFLPLYVEYILHYSNNLYNDMSFVVVENNKSAGICFLPIENEKFNTITLADAYTIVYIVSGINKILV